MELFNAGGSTFGVHERQKGNDACTLDGVGEIALLLGGQTGKATGKDLAAFSDELLEKIHIFVIDGITGLDRRKTLLEKGAGHDSGTDGGKADLQGHLISLWSVDLLQWGQNFLISSRSVVFRRFFSVV
jgi:hypothetical protein